MPGIELQTCWSCLMLREGYLRFRMFVEVIIFRILNKKAKTVDLLLKHTSPSGDQKYQGITGSTT